LRSAIPGRRSDVFKIRRSRARYPAQPLSVTDEGLGGETTAQGRDRLPGVLSRDQPEVLLLLEGVNDLNGGHDAAIPGVVSNLRSMIRTARSSGVVVLIGTLLPERPGGFRALAPESIVPANNQIRPMALAEATGRALSGLRGRLTHLRRGRAPPERRGLHADGREVLHAVRTRRRDADRADLAQLTRREAHAYFSGLGLE
jgi:hypothetical protein